MTSRAKCTDCNKNFASKNVSDCSFDGCAAKVCYNCGDDKTVAGVTARRCSQHPHAGGALSTAGDGGPTVAQLMLVLQQQQSVMQTMIDAQQKSGGSSTSKGPPKIDAPPVFSAKKCDYREWKDKLDIWESRYRASVTEGQLCSKLTESLPETMMKTILKHYRPAQLTAEKVDADPNATPPVEAQDSGYVISRRGVLCAYSPSRVHRGAGGGGSVGPIEYALLYGWWGRVVVGFPSPIEWLSTLWVVGWVAGPGRSWLSGCVRARSLLRPCGDSQRDATS